MLHSVICASKARKTKAKLKPSTPEAFLNHASSHLLLPPSTPDLGKVHKATNIIKWDIETQFSS